MASTTTTAPLQTPARSEQLRMVLRAVEGEIEPVPLTTGYRWAMALVACGMLLLAFLYACIVLLSGWFVYWHATSNFKPLLAKFSIVGLALYLVVLLVSAAITFFLIKPILARGGPRQTPQRLKRDAEPFLYDYVEAISRAVHAPAPRSIRVDCAPNASAGYRKGLWSMFSNDMTLSIGLTLARGLSLRQLSGVLAHELGHFAQQGGMRISYLTFLVYNWFGRTGCERDHWDEWLFRQSVEGHPVVRGLCYTVRFFVWLSRWVPWGLMVLAWLMACTLLRQREFDADRYEARLAGTRIFESTTKRLAELTLGHQWAVDQLPAFWDEGRLADDLAALSVANVKYITPEIRKVLREHVSRQKTGLFDTHPSDVERVSSARDENAPGLFHLSGPRDDLPATVIFRDINELGKAVTLKYYREDVGLRVSKKRLHPVKDLLQRMDEEREAGKALHRYFQVRIPVLWPLPIDRRATNPPRDAKEVRDDMKSARRRMLDELEDYKQSSKRYENVESKLFDTAGALALFDVGLPVRGAEFGLKRGSHSEAEDKNRRAREALENMAAGMLAFESAAGQRLSCALQLLQVDQVIVKIADGQQLRFEITQLVPEALFVSELMAELRTFRVFYHKVAVLCSQLDRHHENPDLIYAILGQLERFHRRLTALHERLKDQPYPFDHAQADMTLQEYAIPAVPDDNDVGEIMEVTSHLFEQLVKVQVRLFARLAAAAEKVEEAFGLERLPEPEDDEDEPEERD
jgi:Zn-dependent protease with chaperone function